LRSFQENLAKFNARGIRVIALSVDTPSESEHLRQTAGYSFLFLCDEKLQVIRKWDLVHPHARAQDDADIARPAEFLLDANGTVRWVNFTDSYLIRARPQQVLAAIDANRLTGE
jgi:peroxiredoxin